MDSRPARLPPGHGNTQAPKPKTTEQRATVQQQTHTIEFSFTKPPLTANQRHHWATRARLTKQIRRETYIRAKAMRLPHTTHATITLHYQPRDNRRRDADNLVPTLKAICDGLTDANLVNDDTPTYMTKHMPQIHPAKKGQPGKCWIEVTL